MGSAERNGRTLALATEGVHRQFVVELFAAHVARLHVSSDERQADWNAIAAKHPAYAAEVSKLGQAVAVGDEIRRRYPKEVQDMFPVVFFGDVKDIGAREFLTSLLAARFGQEFGNLTSATREHGKKISDEVKNMATEMGLMGTTTQEQWQHVTLDSTISAALSGKLQIPSL